MKKTNGITLVALIITIIIMLILVAVSISILINSGLIGKAKKAGQETESAYEEESRFGDNLNINGVMYNSIEEYIASESEQNDDNTVLTATPVYAKLYNDGTLILSSTNYTDPARTLTYDFGEVLNKVADNYWSATSYKPLVTKVLFYDAIIPTSTAYYFNDLPNLSEFENMSNLKTGLVTDMQFMFADCPSLTSLDVSSFDTSNVTTMKGMFKGYWNVFRQGGGYTHDYNSQITELNLSNFNTSKVTDMSNMFIGQVKLQLIDLSSFDTSNVTNMSCMFADCTCLTNLDISSFDNNNVTNFTNMFYYQIGNDTPYSTETYRIPGIGYDPDSRLKTIIVSEKWNSNNSALANASMFYYCKALVGGNGTTFNSSLIKGDYARIDTVSTPGYFTAKTN